MVIGWIPLLRWKANGTPKIIPGRSMASNAGKAGTLAGGGVTIKKAASQ
jgi:hypothetical protein